MLRTPDEQGKDHLHLEDIAERKQPEEAMRESEDRYRALFDQSRDAIYISSRDGSIVDANRSMLELFGYTREELMGLLAQDTYVDPAQRRRYQREIEEKGTARDYEVKLRKKDGTEMDCLVTATVRRAKDGSVVGYQGIIHDITERKRAEEEISHRTKQLALINEVGQRIAPILELTELYQTVVESIQRAFGYQNVAIFSAQEGEVALEAVAGPQAELMPSGYAQKIGDGMVGWVAQTGETLLANDVTKEPRFLHLEFLDVAAELDVPIKVSGNTIGVLLVDSDHPNAFTEADITTLETIADQVSRAIENARLYDAAEKKIDELSTLLMSHELRSPLTNIKAAIQTWNSLVSDGDALQKELVDIVLQESDRLVSLLDMIWRIAALEVAMTAPEWREVSLRSLVAKGADPSSLSQHGHCLEALVEDDVRVRADEGWTVMAIRNLLENAIKHCPAGSHIELRGSRMDEHWAKITVADNGPGLAAADTNRIFQKFYRGQSAIDKGISGWGLGLYLVKLLVEAQGGRVWVDSEEGNGATFSFSLPLAH